ncbi:hypothetical protein KR074_002020, partial [Drosophila pseudoananassae]
EFVVEKISGKRFNNGRPELLVKWSGYAEQDSSWEPLENLGNCIQMVCEFEAELFHKTGSRNKNETRNQQAKDILCFSPKTEIATGSIIEDDNTENNLQTPTNGRHPITAPAKTPKRKVETLKRRRDSVAIGVSSQAVPKQLKSKSQQQDDPRAKATIQNNRHVSFVKILNLSDPSDDEDVEPRPQMLPQPLSDILQNSIDSATESPANLTPKIMRLTSSSGSASDPESRSSQSSEEILSNANNSTPRRMSLIKPEMMPKTPDTPGNNTINKPRRKTYGPESSKVKVDRSVPATPTIHISSRRSKLSSCSSASSRNSLERPAWKLPLCKKDSVYGLDRGLPLEKVVHSYRLKEHIFLFVKWQDCSAMDAVLLDDIKQLYPLQVIEYFESLKLQYDA